MARTLSKTNNKPTHEEIAARAYLIFEQSGRVPGRDLENWLAAEAQLMGKHQTEADTDSVPGAAKTLARPPAQEAGHRRI
jgi:hypothetical protein